MQKLQNGWLFLLLRSIPTLPFEPRPARVKNIFSLTCFHASLINAPLSCFQLQGPFSGEAADIRDLTPLPGLALQQRLLSGRSAGGSAAHCPHPSYSLSLASGPWVFVGPMNCGASEPPAPEAGAQKPQTEAKSCQHGYDCDVAQPRNSPEHQTSSRHASPTAANVFFVPAHSCVQSFDLLAEQQIHLTLLLIYKWIVNKKNAEDEM